VDEEEEEVGGRGRLEEENEVSRAAADADVGAVEPTGELTDAVAATTASAAGRASAEGVEAAASTARSDVAMTERGGDDISPASVICPVPASAWLALCSVNGVAGEEGGGGGRDGDDTKQVAAAAGDEGSGIEGGG
jgi:hypothetical protein